ncbi:hypothetical protein [Mesorhizobium ventifaucium]|uniref:Uncharacterized protein n=1 Tax=Mesorhizobium ventifaucium TaxID=666020 RepID=A0ABN8JD10_9HYPH|nr:hypothetical protein [Mesorhizobium ventifaucium]CAH2394626.1 hypothetical protein MES4922_110070 [Mesorhizobium ventifaucium]
MRKVLEMNDVGRQAAELSQRLGEEVECIVALRKERSAWPGAAPHAGRSPPHTRRRAGEEFDPHAIDLEPLGVPRGRRAITVVSQSAGQTA